MADQDTTQSNQICHVINFDLGESSEITELTVRVRGKWFHISLRPDDLKSSKQLQTDYKRLFDAARQQKKRIEVQMNGESVEEDDPNEKSKQRKESNGSVESAGDSGYVSEDSQEDSADKASNGKQEEVGETDAEQELQNWLLAPFASQFGEHAPEHGILKEPTLVEWFNTDMFFFSVKASEEGDELDPVQVHDRDGKRYIQDKLIPHMSLPKYLRSLSGIPWISPSDVHVLSESASPDPVHPAVVRVEKVDSEPTTHFMKMVAAEQEPAIKREIKLLHEIWRRGLHDNGIRVPHLEGIVSDIRIHNSQVQLVGFLITAIPSPTPLTQMIDSSIPQSKRNRWAEESQRMVQVLHSKNIVWGDAKADNFVVDKNEKLWMIDFGGSYTEGWVDPELMETKEGDDMGVDKIEEALRDPEENSFDPQSRSIEGDDGKEIGGPGVEEAIVKSKESRKRKRDMDVDAETDVDTESSPGSEQEIEKSRQG